MYRLQFEIRYCRDPWRHGAPAHVSEQASFNSGISSNAPLQLKEINRARYEDKFIYRTHWTCTLRVHCVDSIRLLSCLLPGLPIKRLNGRVTAALCLPESVNHISGRHFVIKIRFRVSL